MPLLGCLYQTRNETIKHHRYVLLVEIHFHAGRRRSKTLAGGNRGSCVAGILFFPPPGLYTGCSSGVPSAVHKAVGARQLQPGREDSKGPALPTQMEMSNTNAPKSLLPHPCPQLRMSRAPALAHTLYTGIIPFPGYLWELSCCFKLNFVTEI